MVAMMGITLYAQRDIVPVMKEVGPTNAAMGKATESADVVANAEKLQGLFKEVGVFMKAQKQDKAVAWANDAQAAAGDVAKASKAGDAAGLATAKKTLAGTCTTCHAVHRDMTGGVSKYKPAP
jgi:cytochrome c556